MKAIEIIYEKLLLDSVIDRSVAGCAFNRDPCAWIHTMGFAKRYGMPKRWIVYAPDNIDLARGSNQTTDKTKKA